MKILICGERFLARFGADRVLLLLGERLSALGHEVVWMGLRFDEGSRARCGPGLVVVPDAGVDYIDIEEHTDRWLRARWDGLFAGAPPVLAIVGGWPFYTSLPFLSERCPVVAVDFGAVPLDGLSGGLLAIQQKLRHLRARYLDRASLIVAISRFIARTQSESDSRGRTRVASILLGADHVDEAGRVPATGPAAGAVAPSATVAALHRDGKQVILNLGRWEPGGYKNSEAAFELLRRVRDRIPGCTLMVLAPAADVALPADLEGHVVCAGFPDDGELVRLMASVDLGVSVSTWEGFNLPLAEMQWLGRPALVLDGGAHPEVVADAWYLCRDLEQMADKADRVLSAPPGSPAFPTEALARFRGHFRWDRVVREFLEALRPLTGAAALLRPARILVDVTNATRDLANSGVIRVTRRLGRELQDIATPVFVVWDDQAAHYVLPTSDELAQLGQFNGPVAGNSVPRSPAARRVTLADQFDELCGRGPCCLLLTETVPAARVEAARAFASARGITLVAIFYDAIPVLHPELCPDPLVRDNHGAYMRALAACDVVLPISGFSGRCLAEYWAGQGLAGGPILPVALPGELAGLPRGRNLADSDQGGTRILCVSTLEPRKNHAVLLAACRLLDERFPGLDWSLTLVGNRYAGAFDIADAVEEAARKDPRIEWRGVVTDGELIDMYQRATFTVYPSLVEGFGLPVLESLWAGRPCVCRDQGVMAELAAGGGCLTVDVTDPAALCEAMGRLATDHDLRRRLADKAAARSFTTWPQYAADVATALASVSTQTPTPAAGPTAPAASGRGWADILYPGCLLANWQQDDSERLAMIAVLVRHRPRCSIEIGTYRGGSLSLIRQHCPLVFSIDIEPAPDDLRVRFPDVSFLRGPSRAVLPILFRELDAASIPVDFILVDGDHSADGVAGDIACVLDYVPRAPLFVLLHDSFNPECRAGMLAAPWPRSPYVAWVDLDVVPGRLVENGGAFDGELWGGLAMAYLTPRPRAGDLVVHASAARMLEALRRLSYPKR